MKKILEVNIPLTTGEYTLYTQVNKLYLLLHVKKILEVNIPRESREIVYIYNKRKYYDHYHFFTIEYLTGNEFTGYRGYTRAVFLSIQSNATVVSVLLPFGTTVWHSSHTHWWIQGAHPAPPKYPDYFIFTC